MKIQTLGGCCRRSAANHEAVVEAAKELGIADEVENVSDVGKIMSLGVMATPGLAIGGRVVSFGRVLSVAQAKELLSKAMGGQR